MKITICGSMSCFEKMESVHHELENIGHVVDMPDNEGSKIDFNKLSDAEQVAIKKGFVDGHIDKIKQSDAILVVNEAKDEKENYIGANTFIEMAFAYILNKKIYLLNDIPEQDNTLEIKAMTPVVLSGDISDI